MSEEVIIYDKIYYGRRLQDPIILERGQVGDFCWVIMTYGSYPCAYIGLDKSHPLYEIPLTSEEFWDINCHGGLTYFSNEIDFYNKKNKFWLGWDYGHGEDHQENGFINIHGKKWSFQEIKKEVFHVIEQLKIRDKLEYKINNLITIRLQGIKSVIYIKKKPFIQCKFLLLNIPVKKIPETKTLESIDQVEEYLNREASEVTNLIEINITPEEQFRAHCSNLQVWAENNYNTHLLHRNLSFPLLKALTDAGDKFAKIRIKEEIFRRYNLGITSVKTFLLIEGYLNLLNPTEKELLNSDT